LALEVTLYTPKVSNLVELDDVSVTAGSTPIISSVSLILEEGKSLAIQGPNGAGKTTLLRVIATLLAPSKGEGRILGARIGTEETRNIRHRIGLAGHVPAVFAPLTLLENLVFVADLTGRSHSQAKAALDLVGLGGAENRKAGDCSHGMLRRADLARLFLHTPLLLLLDEPHAGLDSSAQPLIAELVGRTRRDGGGAVLVSHDPTTLLEVADRTLTLRAGNLEPAR
jgi:heme ABC exporter ATP-binding subunit CcmA